MSYYEQGNTVLKQEKIIVELEDRIRKLELQYKIARDALYAIACHPSVDTRDEMIDVAADALSKLFIITGE